MSIKIEPWRIPEDGLDVEGQVPAEVVALKEDKSAPVSGPIDYELHVQCLEHELLVTGQVSTEVKFICSRCADSFVEEVSDPAFFFEQEVPNLHETLDLTDEVRETIILAFPNYPLCQESCHGLCPVCGANLNRVKCGCTPLKEKCWTAFSGLDNIEVKNGSSKKKKIES
ncbi:MAG: DUF177 domain-containing protein [bacterium]|jgi:uncharacterized protein